MRRVALSVLAFVVALTTTSSQLASADTIVVDPIVHSTWLRYNYPPAPADFSVTADSVHLEEQQGPLNTLPQRAVLVFELPPLPAGDQIVALTLDLWVHLNTASGWHLVDIEGLAVDSQVEIGNGLNPHIHTTIGPLSDPCLSGSCAELLVSQAGYLSDFTQPSTYQSEDVSAAIDLLSLPTGLLQFNLKAVDIDNISFESASLGSHLPRLTIETAPIPEPGTALLLGVGLAALSSTRRCTR